MQWSTDRPDAWSSKQDGLWTSYDRIVQAVKDAFDALRTDHDVSNMNTWETYIGVKDSFGPTRIVLLKVLFDVDRNVIRIAVNEDAKVRGPFVLLSESDRMHYWNYGNSRTVYNVLYTPAALRYAKRCVKLWNAERDTRRAHVRAYVQLRALNGNHPLILESAQTLQRIFKQRTRKLKKAAEREVARKETTKI